MGDVQDIRIPDWLKAEAFKHARRLKAGRYRVKLRLGYGGYKIAFWKPGKTATIQEVIYNDKREVCRGESEEYLVAKTDYRFVGMPDWPYSDPDK